MMKAPVYDSVLEMTGNTPMLRLHTIGKGIKPELLVKLEFRNPTCSVKDRIALYMIEQAEKDGRLKKGATIIEPTTGNTGIALSLVAARKGYKMIVVMPEFVSRERRIICEALGSKVVLTRKELGVQGVLDKANELVRTTKGGFMPDQFRNENNPKAHEMTTGKEIIEQCDGKLDAFVAAAGTGGTMSGVARALRKHCPDCKIVIVEPAGSAILSGGKPGMHKIEGIGEGFVPDVLDTKLFDDVVAVSDEDAMAMARRLAKEEGVMAGISSGANVFASLKIGKKMKTGRIVTLIPDCALRYLSTELHGCKCTGPE